MNFERDDELFQIAKYNRKVRESFKKYCHERPGDVVGYNLF